MPAPPSLLGRPPGACRPSGRVHRPISSCSTIRSPARTSSRSRPTPAPGPSRSSTHNGLVHPALLGRGKRPRSSRSARARRSTFPGGCPAPSGFNRLTVQVTPAEGPLPGQRPPLLRGRRPEPDQPLARPAHLPRAAFGLAQAHARRPADDPARGPAQPRRSARGLGLQLLRRDPARRGGPTDRPTSAATSRIGRPRRGDVRDPSRDNAGQEAARPGQARRLRLGGPGRRDPRPPRVPGATPRTAITYDRRSRRLGHRGRPEPALLLRPLRDGDVLTYEFLYEPGQVMVHPALDRLAFLLEPEGVKVHWMTAGGSDLSGLPADNAADEPANRRGPDAAPLEARQWNAVEASSMGPTRSRSSSTARRSTSARSSRASAASSACSTTRTRPPRRCATSCSAADGPKSLTPDRAGRPDWPPTPRRPSPSRPPRAARRDRRVDLRPRGRRDRREGPRAPARRSAMSCSPAGCCRPPIIPSSGSKATSARRSRRPSSPAANRGRQRPRPPAQVRRCRPAASSAPAHRAGRDRQGRWASSTSWPHVSKRQARGRR